MEELQHTDLPPRQDVRICLPAFRDAHVIFPRLSGRARLRRQVLKLQWWTTPLDYHEHNINDRHTSREFEYRDPEAYSFFARGILCLTSSTYCPMTKVVTGWIWLDQRQEPPSVFQRLQEKSNRWIPKKRCFRIGFVRS